VAVTVYLPAGQRTWKYDFWYKGQRYAGSTDQDNREDAELVEAQKKLAARHRAGGIAGPGPSPRWAEFAGVYYEWASKRLRRMDRVEHLLRVLLRFWGARTSTNDVAGEPYHDLTLRDPIDDPSWLLKFEQWADKRQVSNQTFNHYWSGCSRIYYVAMLPQYRALTGVTMNPFAGAPRRPTRGREVMLTPAQLRKLLAVASYHVRLAVAIGALAPKLRLATILGLRWDKHLDRDLTRIVVPEHKTVGRTKRAQVTAVSEQLRRILLDAKRRQRRGTTHVVTYRRKPLQSIRDGVKNAAERAGLPYGRFREDGLTFHTLRHTAATILAELEVAPEKRQRVMGHGDIQTTMGYTHLQAQVEAAPLQALAEALPIADLVTVERLRAAGGRRGRGRGTRKTHDSRTRQKQA